MQFKSEEIQSKVIEKIGKNKKVVQVPILVEPFSNKLECFFNVNKKIQKSGGNVYYGWIIHKNTFFMKQKDMRFGKIMKRN